MDNYYTPPAQSSFKLLDLEFPVLRDFLDVMPLKQLSSLHWSSEIIKSKSSFRGEIVYTLRVKTDEVNLYCYTKYSEILNCTSCISPCITLAVYMGPDISHEALLSKMEPQCYRVIDLDGHYHWNDVIGFLYTGIKWVRLVGNLNLPPVDMEEFFKILLSFKIHRIFFSHKGCSRPWSDVAFQAWSSVIGTDLEPMNYEFNHGAHVMKVPNGDTTMEVHIRFRVSN
uniref:F-box domain-containing protein n=1 Tax=Panagrellus redivivus TaxID=6233 RepID=A0A7E4ZZB1_PANRE